MQKLRDMQSNVKASVDGRVGSAVRLMTCIGLLIVATGCSRAPSFNVLGSFFPAWILCGLIGIVLTVIVRVFLVRVNFERELSPLIVVYPCLAAFFTFTIWLLFFS